MILQQQTVSQPMCERCGQRIVEYYGSGRFCSQFCARSFATSKNREAINQKVSKTLTLKYAGKHKLSAQQIKQRNIQELLSNGYVFVKCSKGDFGQKYLINPVGDVISTRLMRSLKHNAYQGDYYKQLVLTDVYGKMHAILLHRLVAENFIPNPDNLPYINHKDEDPSNNCADNLEWCTMQYNNTYNDVHLKRGKTCSETMKRNGGPWNKCKHGVYSAETLHKMSEVAKHRRFMGNQYVDKDGNRI